MDPFEFGVYFLLLEFFRNDTGIHFAWTWGRRLIRFDSPIEILMPRLHPSQNPVRSSTRPSSLHEAPTRPPLEPRRVRAMNGKRVPQSTPLVCARVITKEATSFLAVAPRRRRRATVLCVV